MPDYYGPELMGSSNVGNPDNGTDSVVDAGKAMVVVSEFLDATGYDLNGYCLKTSNQYSKNFTVEYYRSDSKKLVFHMQADEAGEVYINHFSAYVAEYGS